MPNIDARFYGFQTHIRGVWSQGDLEALCSSEARRIERVIPDLLRCLRGTAGAIALDAPCGYGNLLYLYKMNSIDASGVDLDEQQVALARSLNLQAQVGDITNLPEGQQYDIISSFDFIEHIEKSDALVVLDRFHAALKEGGCLVLRTPCADTPFGLRDFAEDPTHKWIGSSLCLISMLKICGFSTVEVREDWPLPRRFTGPRLVVARILRGLLRLVMVHAGYGHPLCMSSSMILVARK